MLKLFSPRKLQNFVGPLFSADPQTADKVAELVASLLPQPVSQGSTPNSTIEAKAEPLAS